MSKYYRYMVYRKYKRNERSNDDRIVFYGWSHSKNVILAFLNQRSEKKYYIQRISIESIEKIFGEDLEEDTMINYVELISAKTNEKVPLFLTKVELGEAEKKIQRYFRDLSSLSSEGSECMAILELFINLKPYYAAALYYLGFRPPEIDTLFDSEDYNDNYNDTQKIEEKIEDAYTNPDEIYPGIKPVTPSIVDDISKKIIYSLESFIKVLKEDM